MKLQSYGVEGDTYTLDSIGVPVYTDKVLKNPDGLTYATIVDEILCPVNHQLTKNWPSEFAGVTTEDVAMAETWNKDGHDLQLPSLSLTVDENATYSEVMTDAETYMKEMTNKFITGAASIDSEWETYVDTLKNMGIEDAIASYQAAFDRYQSK